MKTLLKKLDTFGYLIQSAFKGIFKNGVLSLASVAVLIVCLLVTGSFYLIITNINYNIGDLEYLNKLVAYVDDKAEKGKSEEILAEVQRLEGVRGASLITSEMALEEERSKHPEYFEALAEGDNPYRDSIVITYENDYDISLLEKRISSIENVDVVKSRAEIAETVSSLKRVLTVLSIGSFTALIIITVFIIITTVKVSLYARKDEISLMYTIGATKPFIRFPFVLEGFFLGFTAAVLAFFVQWLVYSSLEKLIIQYAELVRTLSFANVFPMIAIGFAAIGILTGITGSTISLGKYMRKE